MHVQQENSPRKRRRSSQSMHKPPHPPRTPQAEKNNTRCADNDTDFSDFVGIERNRAHMVVKEDFWLSGVKCRELWSEKRYKSNNGGYTGSEDIGEQEGRENGGPRGRGNTMGELALFSLNLCQLCKGPLYTFHAASGNHRSTIDHILVPYSLIAETVACEVMEDCSLNLSNHNPVVATFTNKPREWEEVMPRAKPRWHKDQEEKEMYRRRMKDRLGASRAPTMMSKEDIENELRTITSILIRTSEEVMPPKERKRHQKPYWSPDLTVHQKEVEAWLQWKEGGKPREKGNHLYRACKESKNRLRTELREAKILHEAKQNEELAALAGVDDKEFWKRVGQRRGRVDKPQAVKVGERVVTDPTEVRETWARHFEKLGNEQEEEDDIFDGVHKIKIIEEVVKMEEESHMNTEGILEEPFSLQEIAAVCKCLKNGCTYSVLLNGGLSREFNTTRGVNQGGILSLLLNTVPTKHSRKPCPTCKSDTEDVVGHLFTRCTTFIHPRQALAEELVNYLGYSVVILGSSGLLAGTQVSIGLPMRTISRSLKGLEMPDTSDTMTQLLYESKNGAKCNDDEINYGAKSDGHITDQKQSAGDSDDTTLNQRSPHAQA
ncbi:hypothetical protein Bbelb_049290 [Branchiostoma belcheri]|nr:hypothetical protein Bbelb_049290 [Branchiostoma belcheri]